LPPDAGLAPAGSITKARSEMPKNPAQLPEGGALRHLVASVIAMGRVVEVAFQICQARTFEDFQDALLGIRDQTHWTQGKWVIGNGANARDRTWNEFQCTHPDIQLLSDHLDRLIRQNYREREHLRVVRRESVAAIG